MENGLKRLTFPAINALGRKKRAKHFSKPPIVIGACPRSGTTLLLSILSAHPGIFTIKKESWAFVLWDEADDSSKPDQPQRIDRLHRSLIARRIPKSCNRWCEKTPRNILYFDKIYNYFNGDVKLIHLVRDGRDVMTSHHPKAPDEFWVDPERWVRDVRKGLHFSNYDPVLTIRYEDLIQNYQSTIRRLLDFIGEPYHPNMDNWYQHARLQKAESWFQPVKKIHKNSMGKWKKPKYQPRVKRVMQNDEVIDLLAQLGYI